MLDKFLDYIFGRGKQVVEFGLIPPIFSAGLQEAIDVAVILNALRASRS